MKQSILNEVSKMLLEYDIDDENPNYLFLRDQGAEMLEIGYTWKEVKTLLNEACVDYGAQIIPLRMSNDA